MVFPVWHWLDSRLPVSGFRWGISSHVIVVACSLLALVFETPAHSQPAPTHDNQANASPFATIPAGVYGPAVPTEEKPIGVDSSPGPGGGGSPRESVVSAPNAVPNSGKDSAACWDDLEKARKLVRDSQFQDAIPFINRFIQQRPLEPEGYFWHGLVLEGLGNDDLALAAYKKGIAQVLKAGMDCAEMRVNAGNILLRQGKTEESLVQYRRAAQIDPLLPTAQLNLGHALMESGDAEGALACFDRCQRWHFEPIQLAYYRAKAYRKAGRSDDARQQVFVLLSRLPEKNLYAEKIKQEFAELLESASPPGSPAR